VSSSVSFANTDVTPERAFQALRRRDAPALLFDGRGTHDSAWPCRLAIEPRLVASSRAGTEASKTLRTLDALISNRRKKGGPGGTGVAMAIAYDAFAPQAPADRWSLAALDIDASVTFQNGGALAVGNPTLLDSARLLLEQIPHIERPSEPAISTKPRTSLPKADYLAAVTRVKDHIEKGDIYQANLTQTFTSAYTGDPWDLYACLIAATPAPRSAYFEAAGMVIASVSPETFVDVDSKGRAHTRPIKGTRPRGKTPEEDAALLAELIASEKDRAELVMIVDLERNDLGRLAELGSVTVPELCLAYSYPAVHHLVARVEAQLRPDVGPAELVRAIFPGGSIVGAPKERAIALLAAIEPVPRGLYTGSLFWFDDDGSTLSSILIRSAIVRAGEVTVGAGGGVVADSDPEAEWMEANAKARALTQAIGFQPEEAV
jgi:anthranilate/para-aminobenzoate synthase component I